MVKHSFEQNLTLYLLFKDLQFMKVSFKYTCFDKKKNEEVIVLRLKTKIVEFDANVVSHVFLYLYRKFRPLEFLKSIN
jgi:hypothetical protein